MAKSRPIASQSPNHLLNRLPADEFQRLLPHLQLIPMPFKKILILARKPIDFAYFPTSGMISAVTLMLDGAAIEVGNIGAEGVAGSAAGYGIMTSAHQHMVQAPGEALRISTKALTKACEEKGALHKLLLQYNSYFFSQVTQAVACNGLHSVSQRCCRWLLMTHDRVQNDVLPLTHEFLAIMLGTRRVSVTLVLQPLQEQGLLRGGRGTITVLDRKGLESAACECYQQIQSEYERLLGSILRTGG